MPLSFDQQLYLLLASGLGREAARAVALGADIAPRNWPGLRKAALEAHKELPAGKRRAAPSLRWADPRQAAALARRLEREGIGLLWRGGDGYPTRLAERLEAPPAWLWVAGEGDRLEGLTCSVVGSRKTPQPLLEGAWRLGRALSRAGVAVVSGLAEGADAAAHAGALEACVRWPDAAGTVAIPARGILKTDLGPTRPPKGRMTLLGLDLPDDPFSAGLAVRRNDLIAAMGQGLVLVASELKGGSSHAVRWAQQHRLPIWCFEDGERTPPGNRSLLRADRARPLALTDSAERWVAAMLPDLRATKRSTDATQQLDWVAD